MDSPISYASLVIIETNYARRVTCVSPKSDRCRDRDNSLNFIKIRYSPQAMRPEDRKDQLN